MDVRRFRADLYELASRACARDEPGVRSKVYQLAEVLVALHRKNLVKINHSALELVCARSLIKAGYEVKVEHKLDHTLVCDVFGTRADGRLIVEIETGFIPPESALEPSAYARARVASKIARYSRFAGKFALGTTPSYILEFPKFFIKPGRTMTSAEAKGIKSLTDRFYNKPQISLQELAGGKLNSIYIIDVDSAACEEIDPRSYYESAASFGSSRHGVQALNRNSQTVRSGFALEKSAGAENPAGGGAIDF